jgi:hypothetical protein
MEWGGNGEGEVSLQATWDQGWTRIVPYRKEGFQVSKRDSGTKGAIKGSHHGESSRELPRGCAMCLVLSTCIYVSCCVRMWLIKGLCLGYK